VFRNAKVFLDAEVGATRGIPPYQERREARDQKLEAATQRIEEQRRMLVDKEIENNRLRMDLAAAGKTWNQGETSSEGGAGDLADGSLPEFLIIGEAKTGTTFLYYLLTRHPYVEPAATKEVHYLDRPLKSFQNNISWYRSQFPPPAWKEGRRVITGEASPYYMYHPHAARRASEIVPEARIIALLRNPVDRAYSEYQHKVRTGREDLSFEKAVENEEERIRGQRERLLANERVVSPNLRNFSYLARGVYVDQLLEWERYFGRERMLVLSSEELFDAPMETLKRVMEFLELPEWEPEDLDSLSTPDSRHEADYESMTPETREQLKSYFATHNQRLYDFLGEDFGW
jgi:hypothetical protein